MSAEMFVNISDQIMEFMTNIQQHARSDFGSSSSSVTVYPYLHCLW